MFRQMGPCWMHPTIHAVMLLMVHVVCTTNQYIFNIQLLQSGTTEHVPTDEFWHASVNLQINAFYYQTSQYSTAELLLVINLQNTKPQFLTQK